MLDSDVRRHLDGPRWLIWPPSSQTARPRAVPLWIGVHGDGVVFLTGPGSRTARNLRRDPRMALSIAPVDDPFTPRPTTTAAAPRPSISGLPMPSISSTAGYSLTRDADWCSSVRCSSPPTTRAGTNV